MRIVGKYFEFESVAGNQFKVSLDDILFVEANGKNIRCYYEKDNEIKSNAINLSMKDFIHIIDKHHQFFRVHKSFVVNCTKIRELDSFPVYFVKFMLNNQNFVVPVSRFRKTEFYKHYIEIKQAS